jgi:hypothetical protein
MATRKIYGTILEPDETPWENGSVIFSLRRDAYTGDKQYPRENYTAKTNAQGFFEATLWINLEAIEPTPYRVKMPDRTEFDIDVPFGNLPLDLALLRRKIILPKTPILSGLELAALVRPFLEISGGGGEIRRVAGATDLYPEDNVLVDSGSISDLRLPTPSGEGLISISCVRGGFRIKQRPGQQVIFNDDNTTLGEGGSIELLEQQGTITLRWVHGNNWMVSNCSGNFEVV